MAEVSSSIPTRNIEGFSKKDIIKSKTPYTKEQIDSLCRMGAIAGHSGSASLSSGVYLGETQEKSIFSKILGTKPQTVYNYSCVKEDNI